MMRLFCVLALLAAPAAQALEFELTPSVGYRFGGQFEDVETEAEAELDPSTALALSLDITYAPGQSIQLFYSRQETEVDDTDPALDFDVEYFQVGGVASYDGIDVDGRLEPFLLGTVGAAWFKPGGGADDETRFSATFGGGLKYSLSQRLALRFEARAYFTFFNSDTALFCVSGPAGGQCLLRASGGIIYQLDAQAGLTFRF